VNDSFERDLRSVIEAFPQSVRDLPDDLRHLPLREFIRRCADPAERARIEPAAQRFGETVAPIVDRWRKGAEEWGRGIRSLLEPWLQPAFWLIQVDAQIRSTIERWNRALREMMQPFEQALERMRALGDSVRSIVEQVPQVAAEYCRPYQRQIARLRDANVRPLSPEDELRFMVMGVLITPPEEPALGYRPPLDWVAVVCRRFDLATAVLSIDRPQLVRWTKRAVPAQDLDDLPPEVFLTLCETVLPYIERHLGELMPQQFAEKLKGWMSDQYLAAAIKQNVIRGLVRQRGRRKREVGAAEAEMALIMDETSEKSAAIDRLALAAAVAEYLGQSKRPELDQQIVEGLKEGRSIPDLAPQLGTPERTLRQRRKNLVDFCARRLGLTE